MLDSEIAPLIDTILNAPNITPNQARERHTLSVFYEAIRKGYVKSQKETLIVCHAGKQLHERITARTTPQPAPQPQEQTQQNQQTQPVTDQPEPKQITRKWVTTTADSKREGILEALTAGAKTTYELAESIGVRPAQLGGTLYHLQKRKVIQLIDRKYHIVNNLYDTPDARAQPAPERAIYTTPYIDQLARTEEPPSENATTITRAVQEISAMWDDDVPRFPPPTPTTKTKGQAMKTCIDALDELNKNEIAQIINALETLYIEIG